MVSGGGPGEETNDDEGDEGTGWEIHPRWSESSDDATYPESGASVHRTMDAAAEHFKYRGQLHRVQMWPSLDYDGTSWMTLSAPAAVWDQLLADARVGVAASCWRSARRSKK